MASSKQLTLFGKLANKPRTVYSCPTNEYEKFVNAVVCLTPASVSLAEAKRQADSEWGKRRLDKDFIAERIRKAAAVTDRQPQQPVSSFVTVMRHSDANSGQRSASGSTLPPPGTRLQGRDNASATGPSEKLRDNLVSRSRSAANGKLVFDFLVSKRSSCLTPQRQICSALTFVGTSFLQRHLAMWPPAMMCVRCF